MAQIKTEQVLSLLKKAYCSGVFGHIDLCESNCIELLNEFISNNLEKNKKVEEIDIDIGRRNYQTTATFTDYTNFLTADSWTSVIVPNGTTI